MQVQAVRRATAFILAIIILATGASGVQPSDPVHVQYTIEYPATMSDAEFQQLKQQVSGRPEHPERRSVESEARRRANGPDRVKHDVWMKDSTVVRVNTSNTGDALYYDAAFDGNVVWMMSAEQLTLANATGSNSPSAPDVRSSLDEATTLMGYFMTEGASIREALPIGEWEVSRSGFVASSKGLEMTRETTAAGAVVVAITQADIAPEEVGRKWVLSEFRQTQLRDDPMPTRFDEYASSGILERRIVIEQTEPVSHAVLKEVTRQPPIDGEDAIRGATTFEAIFDHRKSESTITVAENDGSLKTIPLSQTPEARAYRRIRVIGWITAVVLIGGLAYLRFRNAH